MTMTDEGLTRFYNAAHAVVNIDHSEQLQNAIERETRRLIACRRAHRDWPTEANEELIERVRYARDVLLDCWNGEMG